MSTNNDELKTFSELRGNTLRVYLCIVKEKHPIGAREVQKKLDFSSPALATYHLDKLENMHLIEKTAKGYVSIKEVKTSTLVQVVKFDGLLLPRHIFYVTTILSLFAIYLVSGVFNGTLTLDINGTSAILMGLIALLMITYECVRIWKQKIA